MSFPSGGPPQPQPPMGLPGAPYGSLGPPSGQAWLSAMPDGAALPGMPPGMTGGMAGMGAGLGAVIIAAVRARQLRPPDGPGQPGRPVGHTREALRGQPARRRDGGRRAASLPDLWPDPRGAPDGALGQDGRPLRIRQLPEHGGRAVRSGAAQRPLPDAAQPTDDRPWAGRHLEA